MTDWRRPPKVIHVEETAHGPSMGDETPVRWVIGGTIIEQSEDADRLAKGLLCPNCLEPFPAKPGLDTLSRFREVWADKPEPFRSRAMELVANGRCTACECSVDDAMHELFHEGVEPPLPASGERAR